jgi:HSP20 family protein
MTVMSSWDLFEDLRETQDELLRMNRMRAGQMLGQVGQQYGSTVAQVWAPALDISERKDAYLVSVELPGIGIDDLEITFEDGLLTIQGERHLVHDSSEQKMHRVERRYGTFRRSITLPTHVMADAIEATAQDGVLRVLVPKAPEVHPKRIAVHAGPGSLAPTTSEQAKTRS